MLEVPRPLAANMLIRDGRQTESDLKRPHWTRGIRPEALFLHLMWTSLHRDKAISNSSMSNVLPARLSAPLCDSRPAHMIANSVYDDNTSKVQSTT